MKSRGWWWDRRVTFAVVAGLMPMAAVAALQIPTFRGGVELVLVDVSAIDAEGRPVADLTKSELTLKVDGRAREIRSFEFVRVASDDDAAPVTPPLALPFGSNATADAGRTIIIVLAHEFLAMGEEHLAWDAADRFLQRLTARDRVALITMPEGRVEVDLTNDHDRVRRALPLVTGHGSSWSATSAAPSNSPLRPIADPEPPLQLQRRVLTDLRELLDRLREINGPKTVIFVASTLPAPGPHNLEFVQLFEEIGKAAGIARAQFFVIQTLPLFAGAGSGGSGFDGGLENLAGVTGGEFFALSGRADDVFTRIARTSAAYYLLGFEPESAERTGRSHGIALSVARRGVRLRATPSFVLPAPKPNAAPTSAPTLAQMLKETRAYPDVPLRAAAYSAGRTSNRALNVVVVAESVDPSMPLTNVSFGLIDAKSRRMTIAWPAPSSAMSEMRVVSGAVVPPGAYVLRVAAMSTDGRRGVVEYEFVAGSIKAGPLELGDLMIGQGTSDGTFVPGLEFSNRTAATGYLELRGPLPAGTAMSATFEVWQSADAPPLATVPGIIERRPGADDWSARGAIPLATLSPGDYVVRAVIRLNGAVIGTANRTLRKSK